MINLALRTPCSILIHYENSPFEGRIMVVKRYSSRDARANFSDILGLVYYTKEPGIVERRGKPYAVLISPKQYDAIQQEDARSWQLIDAMRRQNAPFDTDEIE